MPEIKIDPILNVHENYNNVMLVNPYRFRGEETPHPNLIRHYKMEENTGLMIDSTGNEDASLFGTFNKGVTGIEGNCYGFTGDSYAQIASLFLTEMTFECWFNKPNINAFEWIIGDKYQGKFEIFLDTTTIKVRMSQLKYQVATAASLITNNKWHKIKVTFKENDFLRIYIDDIKRAELAVGIIDDINEPYRIGRKGNSASNYFTGKMDEIKIYNAVV